jgi:acetyl esterase
VERLGLEIAFARAVLGLPAPVLRALFGAPRRSPDGLRLDLQTQALLTLSHATRQPEIQALGVDGGRRYLDRIGPSLDVTTAGVATTDTAAPTGASSRPIRVYRAHAAPPASPALVFFHGGGFVVGSLDSHDRVCRSLASRAGLVVVAVDYRLAPEHPFPAAVDDAVAATRWVLAHATTLGIDPTAIAVGGDSAGGTLAAVVAQALRRDALRPRFQLLVYPLTDLRGGTPSRDHFREGYFLTQRTIDWYTRNYVPDVAQYTDPRASPLLEPDLAGLPRALVVTAGFDPLRDEGRDYAEKMRAAGVEVEHVCAEGLMHGFFNAPAALREAAKIVELCASSLRLALANPAVTSAA